MRRLLSGYEVICQEDIYLKKLVRYIHLDPLRAKVISDISELNTYEYCGHSVLMGKKERQLQETLYVLSYFGRKVGEARRRYLAYLEDVVERGWSPELVCGGLIRSLGGWNEVKKRRLEGQDRLKGDERILGESDFMMEVPRAIKNTAGNMN